MSGIRRASGAGRGLTAALALALVLAACAEGDEAAAPTAEPDEEADDDPVVVEIVMFQPPSLGAFLPAVIEDQEFDREHGLDLEFVERDPDAYNTEFATGQYEVGGSASLMSEGARVAEGIDVVYLFNVHDYWATVVSTTPEITDLADVEGGSLAAVTGSTSYAMFQWFAEREGLDLDAVDVQNNPTPALATQAITGRVDAVQMWEPGFAQLMASEEAADLSEVNIGLDAWEQEYGFDDIPYLGVGAHRSWVEENEELVPSLQAVYEDAAEWSLDNTEEAAEIIAATMPEGGDVEALAELLSDNDRLGLNVQPASEVADGIRAVFEAGTEIGYFDEVPPEDTIYEGAQ